MKKQYLSMAIFSLLAVGALAQAGGEDMLVKTKTMQVVGQSVNQAERPGLDQLTGSRAPGDTIWFNDFSTPSDWVISNEVGNSDDWVIGTGGPSGSFAIPAITSTSGGNFGLFDSDLLCSGNQLGNLVVADSIDLSSFPGVLVQFEQYYRRFVDSCYVVVSVDGTNWVKYDVNTDVAVNSSTDNPELTQINISAVAGGQSTVWIGFQFYSPSSLGGNAGCSYAWMVDDVALVEAEKNDLVIGKTYYGDVINDWEYATTPLDQAAPVYLGAFATNNGSATQTGVVCNYDISSGGSSVNSGSFPIGTGTLAPAATDTGWYDTGFTPSALGEYTVTYTLSADSADANPDDNMNSRMFDMTEYEWSHEREDDWDGQYGGYLVSGSTTELEAYAHGSVFYPVQDADLYALKVSFGAATTATSQEPMALTVEIHEIGANIQDIVDSEVQAADLEETGWTTFVLDAPYTMTAGTGYILAVRTEGGEDVMTINGWGVDDDLGAANYGPFGTGGAENWYNGWDYSSAIRAVFDPSVGIAEMEALSGISIYPNPTEGQVTVRIEDVDTYTVEVLDVLGKTVDTQTVSSSTNLDFADFGTGVYVVRVSTEPQLIKSV